MRIRRKVLLGALVMVAVVVVDVEAQDPCDGCVFRYEDGTEVTLTAQPDPGSAFVEWQGDAECVAGVVPGHPNKTVVSIERDITCIARFEPILDVEDFETGGTQWLESPYGEFVE